MFNIPTVIFVCSILSSARASPAGQPHRRQDVCHATVTVTAAGATLQAPTSTSFVILNPTTVTVISSVCNWTETSLFVSASFSTSSSSSSAILSSKFSEAASSTSSAFSQSRSAAISSSSFISSAIVNSTSSAIAVAPSSSHKTSNSSSVPPSSSSLFSTAAKSSVSNTSSSGLAAAVTSSFSSTITIGPILSSITLYTTIIDDMTITSTVIIDDYITSTIDVDVYSTIYNVPSACSAVPTIANPEFNTPLPDSSWAEESSPAAGYDISTDPDYYYNGPSSVQLLFAAGSTKTDILSISQVVTVCPNQVYDFNVYATQESSNTGYCKAWITTAPQIGTPEVGNAVFLGSGNDRVDDWSGIDISFNNAATNSYQITLTISAHCVSGNPSVVYLDTVSVNVE